MEFLQLNFGANPFLESIILHLDIDADIHIQYKEFLKPLILDARNELILYPLFKLDKQLQVQRTR